MCSAGQFNLICMRNVDLTDIDQLIELRLRGWRPVSNGSVGNVKAEEKQSWSYSCILVSPAWLLKTTIAFQKMMKNIKNNT